MWASRVFGVSTTNILFVENDQFLVFKSEKEEDLKKYDCHMGLSGEAFKNRRSIIISDVQASKEYNSLVDSSSLMPVYFAPVLLQEDRKEECLGVFQFIIKPKIGNKKEDITENFDEVLQIIGLDEPLENLVTVFCQFIALSVQIMRKRKDIGHN
mmetsp:Transcript_5423/g.4609  ORF Transcript_5423/g.4609 Transcript_5423/m.4609 type:complete len:155 (+) Transcript_5423:64-528(+)